MSRKITAGPILPSRKAVLGVPFLWPILTSNRRLRAAERQTSKMTALVTPLPPDPKINSDDLLNIVGRYFAAVADYTLDDDGGVSDFICDNFSENLIKIAKHDPDDVTDAVMWIVDCVVGAAAVTMNEPPRKALQEIRVMLGTLTERLRELVKENA